MTMIQRVAAVFGVIFVLVGLAGFTPAGMGIVRMDHGSHLLLGLFPVNALHNAVHLAFGVWGLWASRNEMHSLIYAFGSGAAYLVLGVLGIFTGSLFGIVPIGGYDVHLHFAIAAGLAGCGFWAVSFPAAAGASGTETGAPSR